MMHAAIGPDLARVNRPHLVEMVATAGGTVVETMTARDLVDVFVNMQAMTLPEDRWAKCGACGGESDRDLDACPFCAAVRKGARAA